MTPRRIPIRTTVVLFLMLTGFFAHAGNALAAAPKFLVVSKSGVNCWPQVTGTMYSTIQAAINAMPVAPNGANTVIVCPGTYPEQVVITKNITIMGALRDGTDPASEDGNSASSRIVVPAGGLVPKPFGSAGFLAAQIVAQNISDVNIVNMTLDGHNTGCPVDPSGNPVRSSGVAFYHVGVPGTGLEGNVSNSAILAQIGRTGDGGYCPPYHGQGEGVIVEDSWVTLNANSIHDIDLSPITQTGGITRITSNVVSRSYYGILLKNVGATWDPNNTGSTVGSNYINSFTGASISLEGAQNVLVTDNTIVNAYGEGIWVHTGSSLNDIVGNRIIEGYYGIYLGGPGTGGQEHNNVTGNTIVRSTNVAIVDAFSHGGNEITGNTINDAPIGIFYLGSDTDVFLPNTFYNSSVLTTTGPAVP